MKNRKFWIALLAALLAAAMLLPLLASLIPTAHGATSDEIREQIDELEAQSDELSAQMAALEAQISDNMSEMQQVVEQKYVIDQQVNLLYAQIENINQRLSSYAVLIADKQEQLDAAQARVEELNEKNRERIRAMEENGAVSYWSVLFRANSFSDLLDRINMIQEIAAADQRRLEQMREAAEQVLSAREELEAERDQMAETRTSLESAQAELTEKRAAADEMLDSLRARHEDFLKLLEQAEDAEDELLRQIAEQEAEYDAAKDREYLEWLARQPKPESNAASYGTGGDGTWLPPLDFIYVVSPFGMRLHPILGYYRMHRGVDLDADQGDPIYASRSGVVTVAESDSESGNYVVINHGGGYSSGYMHMTYYVVSKGDYVLAGQIIGYVGSTGLSTGPHLHFSVYYNGEAVNPMDYIGG